MRIDDAVNLECSDEFIRAAECYEMILNDCPDNITAFINLLVLYWQSTDYGFSSSAGLPASFVKFAGDRLAEILDSPPSNFSEDPEFQFWLKYIAWADLGDKFEIEECYGLMRRKSEYYEPAIFIYLTTVGEHAANEVEKLLLLVQRQCTARDRYIHSVVMGIKTRLS
ncbi:hypothetical protein ACDH70_10265 [Xanthomonas axonopodis pv. poinsettiicola]|uniref:hypothetical protein n=1 Tax=Xanthomonas TaxID=338 RepID=UPI001E59EDD2|nr:hypothetical protein [Xanthomonas codiaei]MCC8536221.1 hypothetical protein [Xanthomonas codiaei]